MKKISAIILVLVMAVSVFSFSSCGLLGGGNTFGNGDSAENNEEQRELVSTLNGQGPEEIYSSALTKTKSLFNFEFDTTQKITMGVFGSEITTTQYVTAKFDGTNIYIKVSNDMVPGANMEVWFVDGVCYAIGEGHKVYTTISEEEFENDFLAEGSFDIEEALMNVPKDWFKDLQFVKEGEHSFYLDFEMDASDYMEYMGGTELGGMLEGSVNVDVSYKVYFDGEGNLGNIVTSFIMDMAGIREEVESISVVKNIGTTTVTAPDTSVGWTEKVEGTPI